MICEKYNKTYYRMKWLLEGHLERNKIYERNYQTWGQFNSGIGIDGQFQFLIGIGIDYLKNGIGIDTFKKWNWN